MSPAKVAFIVLGAVALLFVVLVGVGVSRDDGSSDPEGRGWLEGFGFGGAPTVEADDVVQSDCFNSGALRFNFSFPCETTIGESGDRARLMELAVPSGSNTVEVRVDANDDDGVSIKDVEIDPGDSFTASVGAKGAELTFACLGNPCAVDLVVE